MPDNENGRWDDGMSEAAKELRRERAREWRRQNKSRHNQNTAAYRKQRGIAGAGDEEAVIEMGGAGTDSSESRVTEASVRGFWKAYRTQMGL